MKITSKVLNVLFIALLIGLAFGATLWAQNVPAPNEKPTSQPTVFDVPFTTIDGRKSNLYALKGKPVIIHFWATWCVPCVKEFPLLVERLKNDQNIAAIAVSVDQNKTQVDDFLNQIPDADNLSNLYVVHDPNRLFDFNGEFVNRFPESYVLDKDLNVQNHINGGVDWRRYNFDE